MLNKQKTTTLFNDLKKIKVGKPPLTKVIDKNDDSDSDDEDIHYYDEDYDNLDSDLEDSDVPDLVGG